MSNIEYTQPSPESNGNTASPPLITLTAAARQRLDQLADFQPEATGLRISLKSSGCAGLKYDYELVTEIAPTDRVIYSGRLSLLIDPMAEIYLAGSTLDFVDNGLGAAFDFTNPNETKRCGCGKSFTPKESELQNNSPSSQQQT